MEGVTSAVQKFSPPKACGTCCIKEQVTGLRTTVKAPLHQSVPGIEWELRRQKLS